MASWEWDNKVADRDNKVARQDNKVAGRDNKVGPNMKPTFMYQE